MNVLILCTANSCRSQMAEGWLKKINPNIYVESAGTSPAKEIQSLAIKVMAEVGIDISNNKPKNVEEFLDKQWDYVITVCDDAKENCPVFEGNVKNQIHYAFDDPSTAEGDEDFIWNEYRRVSLEINHTFFFINEIVLGKQEFGCSSNGCSCSSGCHC